MIKTLSATEARVHFGELLRGVKEDNATYIVERNGEPEAVVISAEEYERLRNPVTTEYSWDSALQRIREWHRTHPEESAALQSIDSVELIRTEREKRSEHIDRVVSGRERSDQDRKGS